MHTQEYILNIGPQHPSTHGVLRLITKLDGENILEIKPDIGFLHRSIEKICENRLYLQCIPYFDRVDYVASMNAEWSFVLAVEKIANIKVPKRAQYIRVICAELNRIASHLVWLGAFNLDLGSVTPFLYSFRERENIIDLFEMLTGQRLLYNFFRFGGVKNDLPEGFIEKLKIFLDDFASKLKDYHTLITKNPIFQARTKEIGIISKELAETYSLSGPVLRGSGIKYDIRKNEPYSVYDEFDFEIPCYKEGDCFSRYMVRMDEMQESLNIIKQAISKMPAGEILNRQPFMMDVHKGRGYFRTESARGEMGVYLESDGSNKPYRVRIRTGSFANLNILPRLAGELRMQDLIAVLGSLDFVMPEVDR